MQNQNSVTLIGYYGGDKTHCLSAWQSTNLEFNFTQDINTRTQVLFSETVKTKKKSSAELLKMLASEGHHCYDDQTQILTTRGWLYFGDLQLQDRVCAVDINTGLAHFETPELIYSDDYSEPMFYAIGKHIDTAVTKGHRMVVSQKRLANGTDYGKQWEFQTPEQINNKSRKFLIAAQIENDDCFDFNLAKLIGFFIGDGYSVNGTRLQFHIKKQRKIDYLYSLGFDVESKANNNYIVNIDSFDFLSCYSSEKEKQMPGNILKYSGRDFEGILDGLRNSDGSEKKRGYNEFVFYTTSTTLKNQLEAIGCLHRFCVSEQKGVKNPYLQKYCYRLNISKRITPEISTMPSRPMGEYFWSNYVGKVYCVTVSTGAVMVRRNGKPLVSGNTPFEKSTLHFQVTADIATHIHCLKHRIGISINSESARYKELQDKWHIPDDWHDLAVLYPEEGEWNYAHNYCFEDECFTWSEALESYLQLGHSLYHTAIEQLTPQIGRKRAKESARYFLPYAKQLDFDMMFNFRSFVHFQQLRNTEHAQKEVRDIARSMLEQVINIPGNPFKDSLIAFNLIE